MVTDSKQQKIDTLFTELNELALEERMLQVQQESCDTDRIGSFWINTYGGNYVRFTPGFAELPVHLI